MTLMPSVHMKEFLKGRAVQWNYCDDERVLYLTLSNLAATCHY